VCLLDADFVNKWTAGDLDGGDCDTFEHAVIELVWAGISAICKKKTQETGVAEIAQAGWFTIISHDTKIPP